MTYFADLSDYSYHRDYDRPGTKAVGWLSLGQPFSRAEPEEWLLEEIWHRCKYSTAQMRGGFSCELCPPGDWHRAERNGETLLLGTSEIRVFGTHPSEMFAAPTLIYHYILEHQYRPPDVFLAALKSGPRPPDELYFQRLRELGLEWGLTSSPQGPATRWQQGASRALPDVPTEHDNDLSVLQALWVHAGWMAKQNETADTLAAFCDDAEFVAGTMLMSRDRDEIARKKLVEIAEKYNCSTPLIRFDRYRRLYRTNDDGRADGQGAPSQVAQV